MKLSPVEEGKLDDVDRPRGATRLQLAAIAAFIVVYAALSHYSNETPNARGLGSALSLGPLLIIAGVLIWRWTQPLLGALLIVGVGVAVYVLWPVFERHYEWADLVQQCGAYGLLAASFGRSLYRGRVPLCAQIAARLHGILGPAELSYMRAATIAWGVFYALLAASILAIYFAAPLRIWSLFVNFAIFGLIALMALVDHAIRRRVLPAKSSGGFLSALRQALIG